LALLNPIFLIPAEIETVSPSIGNSGLNKISKTAISKSFFVKELILPGVALRGLKEVPQFVESVLESFTEIL
jgi:hypothetical protein